MRGRRDNPNEILKYTSWQGSAKADSSNSTRAAGTLARCNHKMDDGSQPESEHLRAHTKIVCTAYCDVILNTFSITLTTMYVLYMHGVLKVT